MFEQLLLWRRRSGSARARRRRQSERSGKIHQLRRRQHHRCKRRRPLHYHDRCRRGHYRRYQRRNDRCQRIHGTICRMGRLPTGWHHYATRCDGAARGRLVLRRRDQPARPEGMGTRHDVAARPEQDRHGHRQPMHPHTGSRKRDHQTPERRCPTRRGHLNPSRRDRSDTMHFFGRHARSDGHPPDRPRRHECRSHVQPATRQDIPRVDAAHRA